MSDEQTRVAYDAVAADYAEILRDDLTGATLDRAVLGAFAELVLPGLPVGDLGCGPGRITAHLRGLGLDAFGVDLSPGMIAVARRTYPGVRFEVGSLLALDLPDGGLGGALAWYSIIHTPPDLMPQVCGELARVLAPGAPLVLAFQVGDTCAHLDRPYGHDVVLDAYRQRPEHITDLLAAVGVTVTATTVRAPVGRERVPQAYLLATSVDPSGAARA